jgi:hypothetical protein
VAARARQRTGDAGGGKARLGFTGSEKGGNRGEENLGGDFYWSGVCSGEGDGDVRFLGSCMVQISGV